MSDDNNQIMLIDYEDDGNLKKQEKKNILLDLNFYFRRVNRIIDNIGELEMEIKEKQKEADLIMDILNTNIETLTENEVVCFIEENIKTLDDLIFVAKKYGNPNPKRKFSVDVRILYNLIKPLENLRDVIGMDNIKNQLVDQILASLLNLYEEDLMFHTIIKGPPGVGKTMLAKLLGEIYLNMGILKNNKDGKLIFKNAKRSDLVGKFLGHTATKTQEMIDSCEGGVLFIDEVYSLGNKEKRDSFAKECIDTLNLNLTEKKNFICVIAGYPTEIEECFFSYNLGLKRRFPFSYEINSYSSIELREIFISKIIKSKWMFSEDIVNEPQKIDKFIEDKIKNFTNFGGDIDNLILNCKIVHGRRGFGRDESIIKKITMDDIEEGYVRFLNMKKQNDKSKNHSHSFMYL